MDLEPAARRVAHTHTHIHTARGLHMCAANTRKPAAETFLNRTYALGRVYACVRAAEFAENMAPA